MPILNERPWRVITPANITAGPTRTAADTAVCTPADCALSLPSGHITAGMQWRITMGGQMKSVITTPGVWRMLVKLGTTTVFDTGAVLLDTVATHDAMPWRAQFDLTCRIIGASTTAKFMGSGLFWSENILGSPASPPTAGAVAILPWNTAPVLGTGFDSTIANILTVHSTQTVATGSLIVEQYCVEQAG